jgi:hypothetical protein
MSDQPVSQPAAQPKWMTWTGYVLTALVTLFMIMDFVMKFMNLPIVISTTESLGWSANKVMLLGAILLPCTVLYVIPQTSILGAILITGYLGGAVATHIRIDSPLFSHILFGVYLGVMMWGGLWLREPRLRALFPLKR